MLSSPWRPKWPYSTDTEYTLSLPTAQPFHFVLLYLGMTLRLIPKATGTFHCWSTLRAGRQFEKRKRLPATMLSTSGIGINLKWTACSTLQWACVTPVRVPFPTATFHLQICLILWPAERDHSGLYFRRCRSENLLLPKGSCLKLTLAHTRSTLTSTCYWNYYKCSVLPHFVLWGFV